MKILMVSSEAVPFAKTGGLADVAGALPRALHRLGHDVRLALPAYRCASESGIPLLKGRRSVSVPLAGHEYKGMLRQVSLDGMPVYLLENKEFFHRDGLYGDADGDYPDNALRFAFFCRAVLALLRRLDFRPDIIHVNDWQSALIPVYLRTELRYDPFFAETRTLLTLHNLGYQGLFAAESIAPLGLDPDLLRLDAMEYYGNLSFLKGGIVFADLLSTVSPTYCREIQEPAHGRGLDGLLRLRRDDLYGILNGLDTDLWNPQRDVALAAPYSHADLHGKTQCKRALQQELELDVDPSRPLLAVVSRLDPQKGLDLVAEAWEALLSRPVQLVMLGTGQRELMERFAANAARHPGRVALKLDFDDALAHRIYAGSDLFLMPSRYEPCGLGQLIALRYGSVPLVRRTGGLADTVSDCADNSKSGNGFCFDDATTEAFLATVDRALVHWQERRSWLRLMHRGMEEDHSWERAANDYLNLYHLVRMKNHERPHA